MDHLGTTVGAIWAPSGDTRRDIWGPSEDHLGTIWGPPWGAIWAPSGDTVGGHLGTPWGSSTFVRCVGCAWTSFRSKDSLLMLQTLVMFFESTGLGGWFLQGDVDKHQGGAGSAQGMRGVRGLFRVGPEATRPSSIPRAIARRPRGGGRWALPPTNSMAPPHPRLRLPGLMLVAALRLESSTISTTRRRTRAPTSVCQCSSRPPAAPLLLPTLPCSPRPAYPYPIQDHLGTIWGFHLWTVLGTIWGFHLGTMWEEPTTSRAI